MSDRQDVSSFAFKRGAPRKNIIRYYVHYGSCTSKEACRTIGQVSKFISHCLKTGVPVTGVTKA
jgi:hypothetical protein